MSQSRTHRSIPVAGALLGVAALALTACAPPGSGAPAPSSSSGPTGAAQATCGEEDVVLSAYIETGFALPKELFDEFTAQYPNVTFDVREDQFAVLTQNAPRVLQDNPPDLMRLPQMSELASGGLLLDLDPYAEQFGWTEWPEAQLAQLRVDDEGRRGSGPLYAMGLNFSMTGVFYNKDLAAEIGMTEAPKTVAELDAALEAAKQAGITPIAQFNGGATGGLMFPLQALMASYGPTAPLNDWIFHVEGATIDTPENLQATEHLQKWVEAGYFADDVNSMDYSQMMSRFIGGDSLFIFNGDWESGNLDTQMAGKAGFFLMPPLEEGGTQFGAMSAPLTYGIAAGAKNPDCAAFFLNWVATDEKARTITVEVGGSHPMGPADAFMPEVDPESVTAATLAAGTQVNEVNGAMDFLANATGSIYAQSWTPNIQQLVAGKQDAAGLLSAVEKDYQAEVGG